MQPSLFENRLFGQITKSQFLFLAALPDLGPTKLRILLENIVCFDDCLKHEVLSQLPAKSQAVLNEFSSKGDHPIMVRVMRQVDYANELGVQILTWLDPTYPSILLEAHACPPVIYVMGNVGCLCLPQIAIVGSRNISRGGIDTTKTFSAQLADCGFTITSGMAMGADAVAHRGALSVYGKTIAVLGSGVDVVYPKRNTSLYDEILESGGAVVSEFPLGTQPVAHNFPKRNRVISGLSMGVLVVEAALKSGSLITARFAKEQNREVFAVPGSIHNPLARGCHALIKDGAKLVETAQDIIDELSGMIAFQHEQLDQKKLQQKEKMVSTNSTEQGQSLLEKSALMDYLDYDPISLDTLAERCGKEIGAILSELTLLELDNKIYVQGQYYSLAK